MKIQIHVDYVASSQLGSSRFHFLAVPALKAINILNITTTDQAEKHTEQGLTTLFSITGRKKLQYHFICPVVWPKRGTRHQKGCGWVGWGEMRSKRKANKASEHAEERQLGLLSGWQTPVNNKKKNKQLLNKTFCLLLQVVLLFLALKRYLPATF